MIGRSREGCIGHAKPPSQIGVDVSASGFAEQINKTFRDFGAGGEAMDLGCDLEQGVAVCKFIVSTPESSIPGAAFAASENAPVARIKNSLR